jgi:hypothetical protein
MVERCEIETGLLSRVQCRRARPGNGLPLFTSPDSVNSVSFRK